MIPFLSAEHMVSAIMGETTRPEPRNEDYAYHLRNAPTPTPDPLPLRLLPQILRAPLKAHLAARRYEGSLIEMWQVSPHLLKDIGLILTKGADLPDHLTSAPDPVIAQVAAIDPTQIVQAELEFPPQVRIPAPAKPASHINAGRFRLRAFFWHPAA